MGMANRQGLKSLVQVPSSSAAPVLRNRHIWSILTHELFRRFVALERSIEPSTYLVLDTNTFSSHKG
jgi:hypothetical protein